MGITSIVSAADQGTFLAEASRLVDQHEADTEDMRELRAGFQTICFPWETVAEEVRALVQAAEWHIAGRVGAGGQLSEDADEVAVDVTEVGDLLRVYRNALEYAQGEGVDLGRTGRSFLRSRVDVNGFVGASRWAVVMLRHYEQSGVGSKLQLPPSFEARLRALRVELKDGRTEVHQTEQVLIEEAGSAGEAIEAIVTRAERLWRARNVVADHNGRKDGYPGFDLAYIRGALARRRLQREERVAPAPDTTPDVDGLSVADTAPLPGLGSVA